MKNTSTNKTNEKKILFYFTFPISIMAGFALEGINDGEGGSGLLNASSITEYRGESWGIGGDEGAITLANMVSHYNASLEGRSHGSHLATICYGKYICLMIITLHVLVLFLPLLLSLTLKIFIFILFYFLKKK